MTHLEKGFFGCYVLFASSMLIPPAIILRIFFFIAPLQKSLFPTISTGMNVGIYQFVHNRARKRRAVKGQKTEKQRY